MSKKKDKLIEGLEDLDPEKDMPLPERLKVENTPTVTEEPVEASPSPSETEIEAPETKPVPREAEKVETVSLGTIRNRKNAHQARLRR